MKKKSKIASFITGIAITASLLSITASAALNQWSLIGSTTVNHTNVVCKQNLYSYSMENNSSQKVVKAVTTNYRWGIAGYNGNTSFLGWVQGYALNKCSATARVTNFANNIIYESVTQWNTTGNGSSTIARTTNPYDGVAKTYCNAIK